MQVSFIIPLYNCLPLTQAMLASLQATLPAGLEHEILFVDDGSTDGTRDWLATLPPGRFRVLLNEHNLGYARANNRAAEHARGRLLVLLNNDLVLTPRWLEPMLAGHAELGARAGAIGNVQRDARTGVVDHAGLVINETGKPVHARFLPGGRTSRRQPLLPMPAVTGACLLVDRRLWDELGGFDPAFVNGGEDIDFCFRVRARGRINAVALRSVIRHHVSSSPGRKRRDEENSYLLARRWHAEFLAAADYGIWAWCRDYLARQWVEPNSAEYRITLEALLHFLRISRSRPPAAVAGVQAGMAREFARWEAMFPGVATSEPPTTPLPVRGPGSAAVVAGAPGR